MSNSHIPNIVPTIDPISQDYIESVKASALAKQRPVEIETPSDSVKKPLILIPFDDGTVLKYFPRQEDSEQQVVVTATGDQVCITRDASCAELITDGVNVLMRALDQKQAIENEIAARELVRTDGTAEAWAALVDAAHLFVATGDRAILAHAASAWCSATSK